MDQLTMAAASGMRSRIESLDLLANNLANASASGFKADREFYDLYRSTLSIPSDSQDQMSEPLVDHHWTDFSQGSLISNDNPVSVAISGKGFFSVTSPEGTLYTRDGNFRISAKGELQTQDGLTVNGVAGKPIRIDTTKSVEITRDGVVRQEGLDVAKLALADFKDPHVLNKRGRNYFQIAVDGAASTTATELEVEQGKLETANFQPAESAVRLVTVMRQFESLQKAMTVGVDMNKKSVEDVARVV